MWGSALCSMGRWLDCRCSGKKSYRKFSKFTHHAAVPAGHGQTVASGRSEGNKHTLTEVKDQDKVRVSCWLKRLPNTVVIEVTVEQGSDKEACLSNDPSALAYRGAWI